MNDHPIALCNRFVCFLFRAFSGEKPFRCTLCEKTFSHSGNLTIHMIKHVDEKASKSENNQDSNMDMSNVNKRFRHETMQSTQTTENLKLFGMSESAKNVPQPPQQQSQVEQAFSTEQQPFQNTAFDASNLYKPPISFKTEIYRNDGHKSDFYNKDMAQASMIYHRDLAQSENFSSQLIRFTQEKYPSNSKF